MPVTGINDGAAQTEQLGLRRLWYPRRTMIGTTISHYRVTGKLGIGGMGIVYEGQDLRLSRPVALKFLPEELAGDSEAARRLEREARTVAGLNHPNICTVYEVDEHEGTAFIVMERVEGSNLKQHMARQALDTPQIVDIALQITQALEAAHAAGIVHRDIKPGNIVVGTTGQVKVLDFGLARRFMLPETGEPILGGSTDPWKAAGHGKLHGARADPAAAARPEERPVFPGGRDLRDGDGEAAVRGSVPI